MADVCLIGCPAPLQPQITYFGHQIGNLVMIKQFVLEALDESDSRSSSSYVRRHRRFEGAVAYKKDQ